VRIRGYIVFYLNSVALRQSMSIYFGYQNFAKKTQCCRFVVRILTDFFYTSFADKKSLEKPLRKYNSKLK